MRGKKSVNILKIMKIKNQRGFSLIEMMVVVVILGVIVLGLVTFFTGGTKSWVAGQFQLAAQRNARQAMDRMVREIREGKNVISGSDDDTIVVSIPALGSELAYDVTYDLSGTTIVRIKGATNLLIENVLKITSEDIFEYYDSSGIKYDPPDGTTLPTISKIHINLKVDVDKDDKPDITLNTNVNLRNYGL
ncbi:MAG: prepilin-type N-terminal cleavage/methylation domain-containing protein [Candidatus Atribacteria bacterium]|nr:prepilin-type N-terminal cleavage/methylation domain-containing protein [Candidatus Atribacteria bacterium]